MNFLRRRVLRPLLRSLLSDYLKDDIKPVKQNMEKAVDYSLNEVARVERKLDRLIVRLKQVDSD